MAHTKATGKARQGTPRKGRRLGVKASSGETVSAGSIIIRQRGSSVHSGSGTKMAKDFTIFALKNGKVNFKTQKGRKYLEVI